MSDRLGSLSLALLLVSCVILLTAILTANVLVRVNDPGAFALAPSLLNRELGLVTAAAAIVTCLGGAGALRYTLAGKLQAARVSLGVALLAAVAVVAVRMIEFPSMSRRAGFQSSPGKATAKPVQRAPASTLTHVGDASQGKRIFLGTCAACHAPDGSGVKGQGLSLRDSSFLHGKSDEQALAFVKAGRQPFDPESKMHLAMPARGGNPALTDASLLDTIAYARELQQQAAAASAAPVAASSGVSTAGSSSDQPRMIDGELWIPRSVIPASSTGPAGTAKETIALQARGAEARDPSNVRRFFSLLLAANGLHALCLFFGLVLVVPLLQRSQDGAPGLGLAATYFLVLGAMGALLFPAFYF